MNETKHRVILDILHHDHKHEKQEYQAVLLPKCLDALDSTESVHIADKIIYIAGNTYHEMLPKCACNII